MGDRPLVQTRVSGDPRGAAADRRRLHPPDSSLAAPLAAFGWMRGRRERFWRAGVRRAGRLSGAGHLRCADGGDTRRYFLLHVITANVNALNPAIIETYWMELEQLFARSL
ncbi:MAG: hypothetical protein U0703_01680 [Anaerolineae bacterium]